MGITIPGVSEMGCRRLAMSLPLMHYDHTVVPLYASGESHAVQG